jgi:hypothetical protein
MQGGLGHYWCLLSLLASVSHVQQCRSSQLAALQVLLDQAAVLLLQQWQPSYSATQLSSRQSMQAVALA